MAEQRLNVFPSRMLVRIHIANNNECSISFECGTFLSMQYGYNNTLSFESFIDYFITLANFSTAPSLFSSLLIVLVNIIKNCICSTFVYLSIYRRLLCISKTLNLSKESLQLSVPSFSLKPSMYGGAICLLQNYNCDIS